MAHEWINNNSEDARRLMEEERRKCTRCGAEQTYTSTGTWMRIGTRRWEPLAGQCLKKANKNTPDKISIYFEEGTTSDGEKVVVLNFKRKLKGAVLNPDGTFKEWLGTLSNNDEAPRRHCQNYLFPTEGCSPYRRKRRQ